MEIESDINLSSFLGDYPEPASARLLELSNLVKSTAKEIGISKLEETLKWGELSYLSPKGSTIRMDWKEKNPDNFSVYFKCTSMLVPSFKLVYGNTFKYEKNRAIYFDLNEELPETELKLCFSAALQYHKVKHLPNLGL